MQPEEALFEQHRLPQSASPAAALLSSHAAGFLQSLPGTYAMCRDANAYAGCHTARARGLLPQRHSDEPALQRGAAVWQDYEVGGGVPGGELAAGKQTAVAYQCQLQAPHGES